jgi:hypothetical protein
MKKSGAQEMRGRGRDGVALGRGKIALGSKNDLRFENFRDS